MLFSVVVPTYNRLPVLKSCLSALKDQDFPLADFEVIVVDDGSTDGTIDYLNTLSWDRPTLLSFTQSRKGPAVARNLGVTRSSGRWVAFTDDDCLVSHNWLTALYDGYKMFPEAGGIGGYLEAPEAVLKKSLIARLEFFETHSIYKAGQSPYLGGFESPAGGTNNMSYRKEVLLKVGLFDENFPVPAGEDADLKLRVVEKGHKIGYIPLKVTHLDPYSVSSFLRRSIAHGIGSVFFEAKRGRKIGAKEVCLNFFLTPLVLLKAWRSSGSISLATLMVVKDLLMNLGRIKYLRRAPRGG